MDAGRSAGSSRMVTGLGNLRPNQFSQGHSDRCWIVRGYVCYQMERLLGHCAILACV